MVLPVIARFDDSVVFHIAQVRRWPDCRRSATGPTGDTNVNSTIWRDAQGT